MSIAELNKRAFDEAGNKNKPEQNYNEWKDRIFYSEWRVFEQFSDKSDRWYPHGGVHYDHNEALKDLVQKRKRYSKYGRNFELRVRHVEYWTPIKKVRRKNETTPS